MNFSVKALESFERHAKKLIRKYPSLKIELFELIQSLKETPMQGESLGNDCYKIRLKIASKGKGKSGGGRIITCVKILRSTVFLVTIYDKSEEENISEKELIELLKSVPPES